MGEITNPRLSTRSGTLAGICEPIKSDLEHFERIVHRFDVSGIVYTVDDVIGEFCDSLSKDTLFNEMEKSILWLTQYGRQTYSTALRSFRRYREDEDLLLECVTSEVMEGYQAWLQQGDASQNTVSFYIRILRAVYNRAVDDDLTENRRLFRHVCTGNDKTVNYSRPCWCASDCSGCRS